MELRNKLTIDKEEAVNLLNSLASNLHQNNKFYFKTDHQETSVDVGSNLTANITISTNKFSIEFDWTESSGQPIKKKQEEKLKDWRANFDKEIVESGLPMSKTTISEETEPIVEQPKIIVAPEIVVAKSEPLRPRKLKDRIILETTTLPYEGGIWSPSFNLSTNTAWSAIVITSELENTKWATEDQIEALREISPRRVKTARIKTPAKTDDDLFSDLDETGKKRIRPKKSTKSKSRRQRANPAGMLPQANIPTPNLSPDDLQEAATKWKEPTAEENITDDEWVKPSEILKQKRRKEQAIIADEDSLPEEESVDVIEDTQKEIINWSEPTPEDNSTEDAWVKPSEFLKKKKQQQSHIKTTSTKKVETEIKNKKNRPPPKAPDEKLKSKKSKKKGWADW